MTGNFYFTGDLYTFAVGNLCKGDLDRRSGVRGKRGKLAWFGLVFTLVIGPYIALPNLLNDSAIAYLGFFNRNDLFAGGNFLAWGDLLPGGDLWGDLDLIRFKILGGVDFVACPVLHGALVAEGAETPLFSILELSPETSWVVT